MTQEEFQNKFANTIVAGDCLEVMRDWPEQSVDLVFGSPPYEDCRTYGIDFKLTGQDWVDWMVEVVRESLRVCRGLVAFVVEGKTRKFRWSATPVLLMADLHRAGITLRKPPLYERDGISGSGSTDWLRNRYEFIVCATHRGKLPWSDNTAMGHAPIYGPGGAHTNRRRDGSRTGTPRRLSGKREVQHYKPPKIANPGNIIDCGPGGGGNIGSKLAHENEAPFPEKLAEFFIRSFCPPSGIVIDLFSGSGTVAAVAIQNGRRFIGIDLRESQVDLSNKRVKEARLKAVETGVPVKEARNGQLPLF